VVVQHLRLAGWFGIAVGCASQPGPDPSARPPGANWYCALPYCERSAEACDEARANVSARLEEFRKVRQDRLNESAACMPASSASCYTYRDARDGPILFKCFREHDDCDRMRDHDAPLQGHIDASSCGTWR
jgi:hypothetical protein